MTNTINHPSLTKDHRRAVVTYLLGGAAYENIFEHHRSAWHMPISDFTNAMRDVVLESYCSMLTDARARE